MITVLLHLGMNCICNLVASSYVTRAYSLLVHASFSFAHTLSRQLIYWSDHSLTSLTHSLTHSLARLPFGPESTYLTHFPPFLGLPGS